MNNILVFIAKETVSKNYKSYKYSIDNVEVPKMTVSAKAIRICNSHMPLHKPKVA